MSHAIKHDMDSNSNINYCRKNPPVSTKQNIRVVYSMKAQLNRKIRLFVSDGGCTLVMFFFLLDVSIRMQVKFQSCSDWISNCCLDIRVASQSCSYKCNYFRYFSYCFLVLIKLFEEVLKLSVH